MMARPSFLVWLANDQRSEASRIVALTGHDAALKFVHILDRSLGKLLCVGERTLQVKTLSETQAAPVVEDWKVTTVMEPVYRVRRTLVEEATR